MKTNVDATTAAIRLLARREHSREELRQKMRARGFTDATIEPTLDALEAENCLSATRFAEAYTNARIDAGFGPLRIEAELRQRGIDPDTIAATFHILQIDWSTVAQRQYHKRFGNEPPKDHKARAARWRYLAQRGFPSDVISVILRL